MKKLLKAIRDLKPATREGLLNRLSPVSKQELDQLIADAKGRGFITGELTLTEKGRAELERLEKIRKQSFDLGYSR